MPDPLKNTANIDGDLCNAALACAPALNHITTLGVGCLIAAGFLRARRCHPGGGIARRFGDDLSKADGGEGLGDGTNNAGLDDQTGVDPDVDGVGARDCDPGDGNVAAALAAAGAGSTSFDADDACASLDE